MTHDPCTVLVDLVCKLAGAFWPAGLMLVAVLALIPLTMRWQRHLGRNRRVKRPLFWPHNPDR